MQLYVNAASGGASLTVTSRLSVPVWLAESDTTSVTSYVSSAANRCTRLSTAEESTRTPSTRTPSTRHS